jgi:UTP:GlnB (protein PII) uridylyltransferase
VAALRGHGERRRFQVFLGEVVDGKVDLEAAMAGLPRQPSAPGEPFELAWDDEAHPSATRLTLSGRDFLGLLYVVSRCMSEAGYSIEVAHIETAGDRVSDDFYLTRDGGKLTPVMKGELEERLSRLGEQPGALAGVSSTSGT